MTTEGAFGRRQSPSLANAMRGQVYTPQWPPSPNCSTPNTILISNVRQEREAGAIPTVRSSSQRPSTTYLGCSPIFSGEVQNSPIENGSRIPASRQASIDEIERSLCEKLDYSLKLHYKIMKAKLKKVQDRVEQTDISIEKISKLVESVSNSLEYDYPIRVPSTANIVSIIPTIAPPPQPSSANKMTWRKRQPVQGAFQSQEPIQITRDPVTIVERRRSGSLK